jgi:hypothetical protein
LLFRALEAFQDAINDFLIELPDNWVLHSGHVLPSLTITRQLDQVPKSG